MRGGVEIGKGRYGCVFNPPLKCKPATETNISQFKRRVPFVSKITAKGDASREIEATKLLSTIPRYENYFVGVKSYCVPEDIANQTEPDIKKCKLIENKSINSFTLLMMPYSGLTLNQQRKLFLDNYMAFCQHLLEAGAYLLSKKLIHFDLHLNNIVIIEKPRIIDFGVVWSPDTVTYENMNDQLRLYNPAHDQESVEHSFWNGKTNTKYTDEYLIDDILHQKPILQVLQNTLGVPFSTLQKQLTNFATSSSVVRNVDTYNFFKLYWSKFDAWSIGAILATLFQLGIFDPDFKRKVYDPHRVKIISVCKGLLHLDPAYRLDAIEALSLWAPESPVLKEPTIAKWLSSQTAFRVKTASVSGSEFAYV